MEFDSNKKPDLSGVKIAILVANGFHQSEFNDSKDFLSQCGATTSLVSTESEKVRGFENHGHGDPFHVDATIQKADETGYDALLLPGGRVSVSTLLETHRAIEFVRAFLAAEKPVAAISHAPFLLLKAGALSGKPVTSEPSIQNDLTNAGAQWEDEAVVVNEHVVTGRSAADVAPFIAEFARLCFDRKEAAGSSLHTD